MESTLGVSGGEGRGAEKGHTGFLFTTSSLEALLRVWAACSGHLTISFPKLWPGGLIWSPAVAPTHSSPTHKVRASAAWQKTILRRGLRPLRACFPSNTSFPHLSQLSPPSPCSGPPCHQTVLPSTQTPAPGPPSIPGDSRGPSAPLSGNADLPPCQGHFATSQEAPVSSRQPFRPKHASLILRGCSSSFCFLSSFSQGK